MNTQLIVAPGDPPRGVLAGAALLTGARDVPPSLYEALDRLDMKQSAKLLMVGVAGMAMGRGRVALGDLHAAQLSLDRALAERDELQLRVAALEAEVAGLRSAARKPARATAGASRIRWTAVEREALAALVDARRGKRPGHKLIASELSARFGRTFTAKGVAAKARRMGLAGTPGGQ